MLPVAALHVMPVGQTMPVPHSTMQPSSMFVYCLFAMSGLSAGVVAMITPQPIWPAAGVPVNAVVHVVLFGAGVIALSARPPWALVVPVPPVRHLGVQYALVVIGSAT